MKTLIIALVVALGASIGWTYPPGVGEESTGALRADTTWSSLSDSVLVRELRRGGYVLACRHAFTDWSFTHDGPMSMTDRSTQRNLSDEGVAQAKALGREIERLGIPIGPVLSSPVFRNKESAELAFGRIRVHDALYGRRRGTALRVLFTEPTAAGWNRVLMTHQSVLREAMERFKADEIEEGNCVIVRPQGEQGFTIVAHLSTEDWRRLR
jgi:phosphohistidine phosphatase SixA